MSVTFLDSLKTKLQRHPKRIVFPEGGDPRIIQASRQIVTQELGVPILLGDRAEIKKRALQLNINLQGMRIIEPVRTDEAQEYAELLANYRHFSESSREERQKVVLDTNYYAALMVANGHADGVVSGATSSASSALRPLIRILPKQEGFNTISSLLILDVAADEDERRVLFLADTAVIPDPRADQLSDIAITTAKLSYHLTNEKPKIAFLSYTTHSETSQSSTVAKLKEATEITKAKLHTLPLEIALDGEIQADAALDPFTARIKNVPSEVAGHANVLIFPDLFSSNIASKMVQFLASCRSYGQILTGFDKPAAEISRSASAHDILGTAVIVAAQAIDMHLLFEDMKTLDDI